MNATHFCNLGEICYLLVNIIMTLYNLIFVQSMNMQTWLEQRR